ncbi:MAG: FGGY family carbohydrate kinase [Lachnospiraceae bacterium]|nr:FGGY family carbohydrate kinase [Lachnospiraceae bacterium]
MKIAGLDIGTTGCKLTVFDETGKYLDKAYGEYQVSRHKSEHEINAGLIRDGVMEVIRAMAEKYGDIAGIGVTSFGETFVCTDEEGNPLLDSLLYTDPRGAIECEELVEKLGRHNLAEITGLNPHCMYGISKMMWIKKHRPEVYHHTKYIFQMEDFVVFLLTGKRQIDYSLATRTMAFDIRTLQWSEPIFRAAGIDMKRMSPVVPTGTTAGTVKREISLATGLREDTKIISISQDQMSAAIGAGVFHKDVAADGAGTVECITPVLDKIPDNDVLYQGSYAVVPYIIPGKYVCYAFSFTGGALVKWNIDNFCKLEKLQAKEQGRNVYSLLEENLPDEPTGLLVLPHFAGAATPYMDSDSKGAILGLTVSNTAPELHRAMMEGVTYEMMVNMEHLRKAGIAPKSLRATGGGANNRIWMQMKADVLNIPIITLASEEAGTVGSAMLTGIAIGVYRDLADAADHMVQTVDTYRPRPEYHEKYMAIYERYKKVYDAVRPLC